MEPNTLPHYSTAPNSLILYIHVAQQKLNGEFASEKDTEKKLMPILMKNVLFHSYTILSHKRVISFHSCSKFFETGATPPTYFHCSYSNRILIYI